METLAYQKEVKANKEHRCDFCCEIIRKGETYYTSTHKHEGEVYDWKTHIHCEKLASRLKMYDECDEGLSGDDFQETVSQVYNDLFVEKFQKEERSKYEEVIQQLYYVEFNHKLKYVLHHFAKLDKSQKP